MHRWPWRTGSEVRDERRFKGGMPSGRGPLVVSSIYHWHKADFGGTDDGVLAHLDRYAAPELAATLAKRDRFDHHYDWRLNAPPSEQPIRDAP